MKKEANPEEPEVEEPKMKEQKPDAPKVEEPPKTEEGKPQEGATLEAPKVKDAGATGLEESMPKRKSVKKVKEPKPLVDYHTIFSGYVEKKGTYII